MSSKLSTSPISSKAGSVEEATSVVTGRLTNMRLFIAWIVDWRAGSNGSIPNYIVTNTIDIESPRMSLIGRQTAEAINE